MEYRRDIDGLRAIAVLSVVLFHFGLLGAGGGFVGVDVFFVISGYLITGVLKAELAEQRFSLARFYERRARRIFPALFVVHLFCLVGSACVLLPSEARDVGRDVLASLGFVSNLVFAGQRGGYFNQLENASPLLHTWSLSVEEQFYLGLPLLLWGLGRFGARVTQVAIAALAVLSLALSEWMVDENARGAFYLVQSRAWELLLGAALALGLFGRVRRRPLAEGLGVAGLALIAVALTCFDESTSFPGLMALLPCVGAAAVLHGGSGPLTFVARALGQAPLRFVGLISYSLYLWHWPLVALFCGHGPSPSLRTRLAFIALSFVLAALSYRFVEQPFRRKPYRTGTRRVLLRAAAATTAVAVLALGIPRAAAALRPNSAFAEQVLNYRKSHPSKTRNGVCFLDSGFRDFSHFKPDICLALAPDRRNLLVLGDSHAAHFTPAFAETRPDIHVLQATASGCPPLRKGSGAPRCRKLYEYVFEEYLPKHHVDTIVLASHWPGTSSGDIKNTVAHLRKFARRVVVFGPVAEYDDDVPRLLARSLLENDPALPTRHLRRGVRRRDDEIERALRRSKIEYYSVYDATCPGRKCTLWVAPGVPMQIDAHHLSLPGAKLVLERLGPGLFH